MPSTPDPWVATTGPSSKRCSAHVVPAGVLVHVWWRVPMGAARGGGERRTQPRGVSQTRQGRRGARGAGVRRWRGGRLVLDRPACGRPEGGPEQGAGSPMVRRYLVAQLPVCAIAMAARRGRWWSPRWNWPGSGARPRSRRTRNPSLGASDRQGRSSGPAPPRFMSRWAFAGRANQDVAAPCFC